MSKKDPIHKILAKNSRIVDMAMRSTFPRWAVALANYAVGKKIEPLVSFVLANLFGMKLEIRESTSHYVVTCRFYWKTGKGYVIQK